MPVKSLPEDVSWPSSKRIPTHTHTRVRQPERKSGWLLFHIFLDTFSVGNSTRLSYTIRDQRPRGICIEDVFFPIFPLTCRKQYQLFSTGDNQRNRFPCANYFLWEASSGISRVVVNYRFIGEPRETMFLQKWETLIGEDRTIRDSNSTNNKGRGRDTVMMGL